MKVKVCGITRADQFNTLAQMGVDMIGFNFYPSSERYVSNQIAGLSSATVTHRVGVFVNPSLDVLGEKITTHNLDMVQLHGDEPVDFCRQASSSIPVIKAFGIDEAFDFNALQPYAEVVSYFLFDTRTAGYGGSGRKFNWQLLAGYRLNTPFLLSGGIRLADIAGIKKIAHPQLAGIDVNSGFEISPGVKDLAKINEMMNLLSNEKSG